MRVCMRVCVLLRQLLQLLWRLLLRLLVCPIFSRFMVCGGMADLPWMLGHIYWGVCVVFSPGDLPGLPLVFRSFDAQSAGRPASAVCDGGQRKQI